MWIEIESKRELRDARKEELRHRIREELKLKAELTEVSDIYVIESEGLGYSTQETERIAKAMTDCVAQDAVIGGMLEEKDAWIILAGYKPEITDPAEQAVLRLVEDLGLTIKSARLLQKYVIKGVNEKKAREIAEQMLINVNTQQYSCGFEKIVIQEHEGISREHDAKDATVVRIRKSSDRELLRLSRENLLSLSLEEMKAIKEHYRKLRREPTDVEMETLAQTWSEHCKHKTFNSGVELTVHGADGTVTESISNLFRETIVAATRKIRRERKDDWLVSVFEDNAGIVRFDEHNCLAFKVETHNHPSALDPYGGAGTGLGGVIRDVLGAGLGAKPIFNTDVFCFASPDYRGKLPKGVMHPKRMFRGVVAGVRDYGNRMGIPTINGSITFHDNYVAPLVYCGTAGIMPSWAVHKKPRKGDAIVLIGGKTGKDGLHGATFSSAELGEGASTSVVQIGNAIEEKKMQDAILEARDHRLFTAITDCGAGGLSSAVGEMGKELGVEVHLEKVPLKHRAMEPWEIWLSESQERMVLAVPEGNLGKLRAICEREGTGMAVIGRFTKTGKLVIRHSGSQVADIDMKFLHEGLPKTKLKATYSEPDSREPVRQSGSGDWNKALKKLLGMPSIASKEWVIRQYDHEVQANTVIKPLTGVENDGPSDASAVKPVHTSRKCVVVANGINPRYGMLSSYWMSAAAVEEALRNAIAAGGSLKKTALLDNFCWPNTDSEEKLGTLAMAAKACHDAALAYRTPFISGKDSLHNEVEAGSRKIPVPETLLISALSITEDVDNLATMDIKKENSTIYVVGKTKNELGGSHYYELKGEAAQAGEVPKVDFGESLRNLSAMEKAISSKLVLACHDMSEGGLAVALAEMCFAGGIGAEVDIGNAPFEGKGSSEECILFSETQSRFIAEVDEGAEEQFEEVMRKNLCAFGRLGKTKANRLVIRKKAEELITADLVELKEAWKKSK